MANLAGVVDLLSTDLDVDQDEITLLNEILNTPATASSSEFSTEWQAAFGGAGPPLMTGGTLTPSDSDSQMADFFMPSSLLDMTAGNLLWMATTMWGKKTAPFYFCNSFDRTSSIKTIFGTHILQ